MAWASRASRRSTGVHKGSRTSGYTIIGTATLKAKLKYIDLEAQKMLSLKELDMTQSKIAALEHLKKAQMIYHLQQRKGHSKCQFIKVETFIKAVE